MVLVLITRFQAKNVVGIRVSENYTDLNAISSSAESSAPLLEGMLDEQPGEGQDGRQSRLISKVLAPALKLWLRSQLDHVEDLHLDIQAGDLQLLSGAVQQVSASAQKGIYQGLHLSQISLIGQQIKTNLGQVLRGKPFRLLAAFPIAGTVTLSEEDLNASLKAPLLANAIADFLLSFLLQGQRDREWPNSNPAASSFHNVQIQLGEGELTFTAILTTEANQTYPITIQTALRIQDGNRLVLERFQCQVSGSPDSILPAQLPDRWEFDLGHDVYLEELLITPTQIWCRGRIMVQP
jgi:hypothetical protein